MSKAESKSSQQAAESSASAGDDWSSVQDPNERRRIQNRIAQRKFRDKTRQQKEDADRSEENKRRAGGSYTAAEPKDLDRGEEEGLPWGSLSLKHVTTTGRTKEQSSKDTSAYNAASRAGGSSRVGLHLVDEYARGAPAWTLWKPLVSYPMGQQAPQRQKSQSNLDVQLRD